MTRQVIARWKSLRGGYYVEAYRNDDGTFSFKANGSGGHGYLTAEDAIRRAELESSFMPSAMKRKI